MESSQEKSMKILINQDESLLPLQRNSWVSREREKPNKEFWLLNLFLVIGLTHMLCCFVFQKIEAAERKFDRYFIEALDR